ncbi:hypothetical protein NE237_028031 [Protea cynaroides]|uniref:Uncharacterized protein n=1 Tax=Protea cynaroides TaxID=273540 RepID=A0A9Q0JSH1_9MAGN|nr:hypothetical protein NE237_028031 [Protea cynaroides]
MRFDRFGQGEPLECNRNPIIKEASIPARDLRILGPVSSQSSNILGDQQLDCRDFKVPCQLSPFAPLGKNSRTSVNRSEVGRQMKSITEETQKWRKERTPEIDYLQRLWVSSSLTSGNSA